MTRRLDLLDQALAGAESFRVGQQSEDMEAVDCSSVGVQPEQVVRGSQASQLLG